MVVQPFANRGAVPVMVTVATGAALALIVAPDLEHSRLPTTTPALAGVILVALLILVVGPLVNLVQRRAAVLALLPLLIGPLALTAAMNVTQTYAAPSSAEYLLLRGAFIRTLDRLPAGDGTATVCITPARWQNTLSPISRYDEFGVVSSSIPNVLQAIVSSIAATELPKRGGRIVFRIASARAPIEGCDAWLDVDRVLRDARPESAGE